MTSKNVRELFALKWEYRTNVFERFLASRKTNILYCPVLINQIMSSTGIKNFVNIVTIESIIDTLPESYKKLFNETLTNIESGEQWSIKLMKEIIRNLITYFIKTTQYDTQFKKSKFLLITNRFKLFELTQCKKACLVPDLGLINQYIQDEKIKSSSLFIISEIRRKENYKYYDIDNIENLDEIVIKKILKIKKKN